eukprot:47723-Eustigmatos_ZCMA.PRE.1
MSVTPGSQIGRGAACAAVNARHNCAVGGRLLESPQATNNISVHPALLLVPLRHQRSVHTCSLIHTPSRRAAFSLLL